MTSSFETIFTGVYLIVYAVSMAASLVFYILQSIGFQTIAKRRGIKSPWLAWIPVGSAYIWGAIADDYNIKARNVTTKYRHILLYLILITMVLLIALYPILFVSVFSLAESDGASALGMGGIILIVVIALAMLGVAIAASVFQYIALYRIYQSCSPKNTVLYFVLTIFISGVLPFFIFFLRNKDEGMPAPQVTQFTQGA